MRIAIFAAMAGLLIVALCVPEAFGDEALEFAARLRGRARRPHRLFVLASRDEPELRHSVTGLAISTAVAVGLLVVRLVPRRRRAARCLGASPSLDMGGPYFFGTEGWKLVPGHFAERHGLILIIALGESIVAIGVGAETGLTWGIGAAAVLGIALAAAMWWLYFDVVALVVGRRLAEAEVGREQNAMARDSYSYLHFPMVAGIVLVALG